MTTRTGRSIWYETKGNARAVLEHLKFSEKVWNCIAELYRYKAHVTFYHWCTTVADMLYLTICLHLVRERGQLSF